MKKSLEIIKAKYLHDHVIRVTFNNNETFEVDFSIMIQRDKLSIYEPLKELKFFKTFHVNYTLCWGADIDVAPEYVYFLAHEREPEYQPLFKKWGYIAA
jgi:hypothetical protein